MEESVEFLDEILSDSKYFARFKPTVADYAIAASISTYHGAGCDLTRFDNINRWYEDCTSSLVGIEENDEGIELLKKNMEARKSQP